MDLQTFLAKLHDRYTAAANKVGRSYQCLKSDGRDDALAFDDSGPETIIRVQGPLDSYWGTPASKIIQKMDESRSSAYRVIIDSPGGALSEGLSLYTDFRARMDDGVTIKTEGRGLVASAAVLPFLAADDRSLRDGTMVMVHNPWGFILMAGDASDIKKESNAVVNALEGHTENYIALMAKRTGMELDAAREAMNSETWYHAADAVEAGYAQVVLDVDEADDFDDPSAEARAAADVAIMAHMRRVASMYKEQ